jgi:histidine triad (HIT) family protein
MKTDCIFCRIIAGESSEGVLFQDEWVTAFHDIHPVAPVHILIVPNKHWSSLNEVSAEDETVLGRLVITAQRLAHQEGIEQTGYRLIINTGKHSGQVVNHLHMHLIGGKPMRYPIG